MDGLNDYTYRECCNQKVRECDDCTCYTCTRCGDYNFTEAKKITAYRIAKDTRLSTQTVYAYFNGDRVSVRTQEKIIDYINRN